MKTYSIFKELEHEDGLLMKLNLCGLLIKIGLKV